MARFSQQEINRMWNMLFGLYEIRKMSPEEQKAYDFDVYKEIQKLEKLLDFD